MEWTSGPWISVLAGGGMIAGLWLLVRGLGRYRTGTLVADTATSPIASVAVGEVRISGVVEPAEISLVSLLQGVSCVYYRSTIENGNDGPGDGDLTEERAIGFRVRDATGRLRVFPHGARIEAPTRFSAETGLTGDEPSGLAIRREGATRSGLVDHAAAVADLLTVHETDRGPDFGATAQRGRRRRYREQRLEPGDAVTIVGRALPFADLPDPAAADVASEADVGHGDPEVAADLADARAAGILAPSAAAAWGNAAIPGFGIGRPVAVPDLHPDADPLPLAGPGAAEQAARRFDIAPDTLILAASTEVPLLIAYGAPGAVVARARDALMVGLLGAILAIASAMVLALSLDGSFGS